MCKSDKGNGVVILDSTKYSLKMKEILSDCTKFVEIREDWKTVIFRYQDRVSRFVDKLYKCSRVDDDDEKTLKNNA